MVRFYPGKESCTVSLLICKLRRVTLFRCEFIPATGLPRNVLLFGNLVQKLEQFIDSLKASDQLFRSRPTLASKVD